MTNSEKKEWLLHEIEVAKLTDPISEYITFRCPWNAKYRVGWDDSHLNSFQGKINRCYGFKNHRGGVNRLGVK